MLSSPSPPPLPSSASTSAATPAASTPLPCKHRRNSPGGSAPASTAIPRPPRPLCARSKSVIRGSSGSTRLSAAAPAARMHWLRAGDEASACARAAAPQQPSALPPSWSTNREAPLPVSPSREAPLAVSPQAPLAVSQRDVSRDGRGQRPAGQPGPPGCAAPAAVAPCHRSIATGGLTAAAKAAPPSAPRQLKSRQSFVSPAPDATARAKADAPRGPIRLCDSASEARAGPGTAVPGSPVPPSVCVQQRDCTVWAPRPRPATAHRASASATAPASDSRFSDRSQCDARAPRSISSATAAPPRQPSCRPRSDDECPPAGISSAATAPARAGDAPAAAPPRAPHWSKPGIPRPPAAPPPPTSRVFSLRAPTTQSLNAGAAASKKAAVPSAGPSASTCTRERRGSEGQAAPGPAGGCGGCVAVEEAGAGCTRSAPPARGCWCKKTLDPSECEPSGGRCALLGAAQQHGCVALSWAQGGQFEGGEGWVGSCSFCRAESKTVAAAAACATMPATAGGAAVTPAQRPCSRVESRMAAAAAAAGGRDQMCKHRQPSGGDGVKSIGAGDAAAEGEGQIVAPGPPPRKARSPPFSISPEALQLAVTPLGEAGALAATELGASTPLESS
eukprot:scaffold1644_cov89-Isochrysis_galbana.AAC.2